MAFSANSLLALCRHNKGVFAAALGLLSIACAESEFVLADWVAARTTSSLASAELKDVESTRPRWSWRSSQPSRGLVHHAIDAGIMLLAASVTLYLALLCFKAISGSPGSRLLSDRPEGACGGDDEMTEDELEERVEEHPDYKSFVELMEKVDLEEHLTSEMKAWRDAHVAKVQDEPMTEEDKAAAEAFVASRGELEAEKELCREGAPLWAGHWLEMRLNMRTAAKELQLTRKAQMIRNQILRELPWTDQDEKELQAQLRAQKRAKREDYVKFLQSGFKSRQTMMQMKLIAQYSEPKEEKAVVIEDEDNDDEKAMAEKIRELIEKMGGTSLRDEEGDEGSKKR